MSYDNPWTFNGKSFNDEDVDKFVGFVYLIVNRIEHKKYIGRKYFHQVRKVKGKSRRQRSDSDWKTYYGSSKELLNDVERLGKENFDRIILSLHVTRGDTNYEEVKQQFLYNVLEESGWYNENINGKWHRKPDHIAEAREFNVSNLCFLGLTKR